MCQEGKANFALDNKIYKTIPMLSEVAKKILVGTTISAELLKKFLDETNVAMLDCLITVDELKNLYQKESTNKVNRKIIEILATLDLLENIQKILVKTLKTL